jgi:hypothetical protein
MPTLPGPPDTVTATAAAVCLVCRACLNKLLQAMLLLSNIRQECPAMLQHASWNMLAIQCTAQVLTCNCKEQTKQQQGAANAQQTSANVQPE